MQLERDGERGDREKESEKETERGRERNIERKSKRGEETGGGGWVERDRDDRFYPNYTNMPPPDGAMGGN